MKLLVHACCGPCSIMPTRLLIEDGHDITVLYANSNIAPKSEYDHRLEELVKYADSQGFKVIEGLYDPELWEQEVAPFGEAVLKKEHGITREDRCRACYRLRLQHAAAYASQHGFDGLTTTLAVSPYQLRDVMHEELDRVCDEYGIESVFQDFTPYYPEATRISRELGMYRQNYCGCRYSIIEAEETRAEQKRERERKRALRISTEQQQKADRDKRNEEKRIYAQKQSRKRAILKALREQDRTVSDTQGDFPTS